jgi:methionine-gamma-lyase
MKTRRFDAADARRCFATWQSAATRRIGTEIELAVVDARTGRAASYDGPAGSAALLKTTAARTGGDPITEAGNWLGLRLADGTELHLEHGGGLEYCSPPAENVAAAVSHMQASLGGLALDASRLGLALLTGGLTPFEPAKPVQWVPKRRIGLMREHFAAVGGATSGDRVMAHTLSAQVTLDFNEHDLGSVVTAGVRLAPVLTALFANSPLAAGESVGARSARMLAWLTTDPARCGPIPGALEPGGFDLDRFVDYALDRVMIFRPVPGGHKSVGKSFRTVLEEGFADGTFPTAVDWRAHLSQLWTDVRVRERVEFRAADGPPFEALPSVLALHVGLFYDPANTARLIEMLPAVDPTGYAAAMGAAAKDGLAASYAGRPTADLAREALELARLGLAARVDAALEPPDVPKLLAPLEQLVATGETFADRAERFWTGPANRVPESFVREYCVPITAAGNGCGQSECLTKNEKLESATVLKKAPWGINTTAVHAGDEANMFGHVSTPICRSTAFTFPDTVEGAKRAGDIEAAEFYGRWGSTNAREAEGLIAGLEDGETALVTSSGLAAIDMVLHAFLKPGGHFVGVRQCYSETAILQREVTRQMGAKAAFLDCRDPSALVEALCPDTSVVFIETPANPTLSLADISGVVGIVRERAERAVVVVDSTFATPVNTQPLKLGADLVVHSATKYLAGHSDVVAGAVAGRRQLVQEVRRAFSFHGPVLDPSAAWLLCRGIRTLGLRVERQNANALTLAEWLEAQPTVARVYYPMLKSHPQHELALRQMRGGGGMLCFELRSMDAALRLLTRVRLIKMAVSLGGISSTITHPASMTHNLIPREQREQAGITDGMLRFSVGIEDVNDLIRDLQNALN